MLESMAEWMGFPLYYAFEGADPPPRTGAYHATIYPYGPFPAGDGGTVMLGLQNEREWVRFCAEVLERPALAEDPRFQGNAARTKARDALQALIVEAFSALTTDQVLQRLESAGIASARMNDMHGLWSHQQLQARGRWREIGSPAGPIPALRPPALPDTLAAEMGPVPDLGEHTDAILRELGFDASTIDRLRAEHAI
jgi:crotonobetainyl-CoA:carnitine CoA-transferase CaiB-like acyl-CoA transferase